MKNIESQIQKAAVEQIEHLFRLKYSDYTLLLKDSKKRVVQSSPLFAVPNGGNRNIVTATNMKKEGAKSGVADLILPIANRCYQQLWIEVKSPDGKQSYNQGEWQDFCIKADIRYVVCYSTQEIVDLVLEYMGDL